ncbi:MAG: hypothetical protein ACOVN9_02825, partial [Inhella sp.]
ARRKRLMHTPTPFLLAIVLAASALAPVQAQTKKELVAKVVALQVAQAEQLSNALAQQGPLQQMMAQAGQVLRSRVPEDKREATGKAMEEAVRAYLKDVQPALRASLVKNIPALLGQRLESSFNEAELKQIVQTLESPVLKRFNQMGGEMQQALVQKVMSENQALLQDKFKALDTRMAELLGLKAGAAATPAPASKP